LVEFPVSVRPWLIIRHIFGLDVAATPQKPASSDALAAQSRLLSTMRSAMRARRPQDVLALYDVQPALATTGALSEELMATRVFALCQLGRTTEAERSVVDFASRVPSSPLGPRVRGACAQGPR
jgi:hypothetical protein